MGEPRVVRVGQVWRDNDRRSPSECEVIDVFGGDDGFVSLQRPSRRVRVRVRNLRSRFTFVREAPNERA